MVGRVAHLPRVVCMHGIGGYFIKLTRLLIRAIFHLEVLIVVEILHSYITKGENSTSRCIGYKFFWFALYIDQCCLHAHSVHVLYF
jgi:hypothetical protein